MRRAILITGCSSGIGFDCALKFQQKGWRVITSCRNAKDVMFLKNTYGLDAVCIDYEKPITIKNGFKEALTLTGGRLDVLFNNGAYAIPAAVEDLPTDALRAIFEANLFGWHTLTRLALPVMFAQKSNHLYLYERFRGNKNLKGVHEQAYHIGIRQHDRWCQGDMPNEMRTKHRLTKGFAPALWRLKRSKRDMIPRMSEPYTEIREGLFLSLIHI